MIRLDLPLMGDAAARLAMLRVLFRRQKRGAVLLHGDPGCAKSQLLDILAMELTGSPHAIEIVNGQSVTVDLVRDWRRGSHCGNLFSARTVKRVDEIDKASPAALAELLTLIDYLADETIILASTNHFATLKAISKGRVETRFKTYRVENPSIEASVPWIVRHFGLPEFAAREICRKCVPDGQFDGVNLRAAVEDAESLQAEIECRRELAAA